MEYHVPVLLQDSISGLNIKPDGTYLDLTFGGGGHSKEILKHLGKGKLIAFDQDADAEKNILDDNRFSLIDGNFRFFLNYLKFHKINAVDGILADLGVSSHHFDQPERGFSFRFDAPLDMRMNQDAEMSAAGILNSYNEDELRNIFRKYGEIPNAGKLAAKIAQRRNEKQFNSTFDFVEAIKTCLPPRNDYKYLAKVFQAIRIEVNNEIDCLSEMLLQTLLVLKPGGRLVIITYHSLEDRLVKNFMKYGMLDGQPEKDIYGRMEIPFKLITRKAIEPNENELIINSRARSARLRIAEKI
ncbi:MAG: 16S rRNA (cytosine(1402)-N(4))-methyltransferase RsmH [Bacteroidales bacterium]|nr:16S rRNA (cytosine(1402)-N(4))-methyltransferase RsmH [Bacteroidales bacterium]